MANGGGGGGGGSYMSVRDLPVDHDIRILSAVVSVSMRDVDQAEFRFEYEIEGAEGGKAHDYYWHIVPDVPSRIQNFEAKDAIGGLETSVEEFDAGGNRKSEYKIRYRDKMVPGKKVQLTFSFVAEPAVIETSARFRKVLFYSDFLSYTVFCDSVTYRLFPPPGFGFLKTSKSHLTPVVDQGGPSNPHSHPIVLQFANISPRSPIPVSVALTSNARIDIRSITGPIFALVTIYVGAVAGVIFAASQLWAWIAGAVVFTLLIAVIVLRSSKRPSP